MPERTTDGIPMLVRGISLISFHEYIKSKLNVADQETFFSKFPDSESETIIHAKKGKWYPFSIQRHLREEIANQFDSANPRQAVFQACLFTAQYETSTFLKGLMSFLPVKQVIRQAAAVWGKYYNQGRMQALSLGEYKAALELTDFETDYLFCPTVEAWLTIAMENMGYHDIEVSETLCIFNNDKICRWEVSWC